MLMEYGFQNFLSFREGVTVSFKLDANCPSSISEERNFATVLCVKGANGSGKTQLLKGLAFLADFATRSFSREPDEEIKVEPFFGNSRPTEFFAEFYVGSSLYRYELSLTSAGVSEEVLYRTMLKRVKLFERREEVVTYTTKAYSALKNIKLRKNASIISTAHQYEVTVIQSVYRFFRNFISNVSYSGTRERTFLDMNFVAGMFKNQPRLLTFAVDFIRECDIGISDIKIAEQESPEERKKYYPVFLHSIEGKDIPVLPATESSGTKQLFRNLLAYKIILNEGGVLVLDEFDIYLHPHILPKLIELFINPETNKKGAQLLFTTHNLEVIDVCGRYRTYLVNKDDNVSYAFRLDEIPGDILRNDRSIIPAYREGRIGGVPRL